MQRCYSKYLTYCPGRVLETLLNQALSPKLLDYRKAYRVPNEGLRQPEPIVLGSVRIEAIDQPTERFSVLTAGAF